MLNAGRLQRHTGHSAQLLTSLRHDSVTPKNKGRTKECTTMFKIGDPVKCSRCENDFSFENQKECPWCNTKISPTKLPSDNDSKDKVWLGKVVSTLTFVIILSAVKAYNISENRKSSVSEVNKALIIAEKDLNIGLPKALDNGITFEKVKVGDRLINYIYSFKTLVRDDLDQANFLIWKQENEKTQRTNLCSKKESRKLLDQKVAILYSYQDSRGQNLGQFRFTNENCRGLASEQ